jgi:Flp pilus assembly protein TadG
MSTSTSRVGRDEGGAVAVVVAVFASVVFFGLGALAVDVARWYLEAQRAQKAADAAALAGVTWMPQDLDRATTAAREVAARNGFPDPGSVVVRRGSRPSELDVTVTSTVDNAFGDLVGLPRTTISRHTVADYTGPQPMASPCNTLGNEPDGTPGAGPPASQLSPPARANCPRSPEFWMTVHGPDVFKTQGDQYGVRRCQGGESGCTPQGVNQEFRPEGYFLMLRVQPAAIGQPVTVQLYDPAYVATESNCSKAPTGTFPGGTAAQRNDWNPFASTDAAGRYARAAGAFCPGDTDNAGLRVGNETPTVTSYGLREPSDSLDPLSATPVAGCTRQFPGRTAPSVASLRQGQGAYDADLARVFHQWVPLCTFAPTRAGDYYLQIRTNVAMGGTVNDEGGYRPGNAATSRLFTQEGDDPGVTGNGSNRFAVRAYGPSAGGVSVAAWGRMPIFANSNSANAVFNLIRVLPGAAGKTLVFSFFDVGDAAANGTVSVLRPTEATGGNLTNCTATGFLTTTLPTCALTGIRSSAGWNGQSETISVPIPVDYSCDYDSPGGCWFQVRLGFGTGSVTDATTWTASIAGDPVRLVE